MNAMGKKGRNGKITTSRLHRKEQLWALLFVAIPILGYLIFTFGAIVFSFYFSFTDYNPIKGTYRFVQWTNYRKLFHDKYFVKSIVNTIILLIEIPLRLLLGFMLANAINRGIRGGKAFRLVYFLPTVSSVVAINIIFRYIFNGEYGILNHILGTNVHWLGTDETLVKIPIIVKNIWNGLGYTMLLYIAGMQGIPKQVYEAAQIDGANNFQMMRRITFPLLTPVTFYLVVTGIIGGLQSYADAQILAAGAPGAQTIVYYIWQRGIDQNRYGLASSASLVLAIGIFIFTFIQFKVSKRWVYEE